MKKIKMSPMTFNKIVRHGLKPKALIKLLLLEIREHEQEHQEKLKSFIFNGLSLRFSYDKTSLIIVDAESIAK